MPVTTIGEWETNAPEDSKVVAIHACLTKNGKVLFFHCRSYPFWTRLYDPESNTVSDENLVVPKWPVYYEAVGTTPAYPIQASKIFCSGHCFLADGRLLVAGGELNNPYPDAFEPTAPDRGLRYSFIFDPDGGTDSWNITGPANNPHIMQDGRWYPTLTLLNDGTVLAMAGLTDKVVDNPYHPPDDLFTVLLNQTPEIYTPFGTLQGWEPNNNNAAKLPRDIFYSYPDAYVIPVGSHIGKVFYASTQLVPDNNEPTHYTEGHSQIFNPFPTGSEPYWTGITNLRDTPSQASSGILMPIRNGSNAKAKCLITGGGWEETLARIDLIDLTSGTPVWESDVATMTYRRYNHDAVILPDRNLLIIGGDDFVNGGQVSVLVPELLNTDTLEWITDVDNVIPDIPVPRNYHSIAILLPDARVLLGGGRVPNGGDVEDDTERRFSIYKPQYLLEGERPVIAYSPDEINYDDETFEIKLEGDNSIDSICFMKPGSVTHGNNMDQRYIELKFDTAQYPIITVFTPDAYKAPPGYYMLFVLKDKSESNSGNWKIPSVAKFVKIS